MKKITFKNQLTIIFILLLAIASILIIYSILYKSSFDAIFAIAYADYIGYSLLIISLLLVRFSYNYIKYDHDEVVLKINNFKANRFSFNSIRHYAIEDNLLMLSLRDSTEHIFNLRSIKSKDIVRLNQILEENTHLFF